MSVDYPFTVPVVLVARTKSGVDAYGEDTWTTTETTVAGLFAPGGSSETTAGGDVVVTQPTVYLPDNPLPSVIDAVRVGGLTYEVDGDPQVWPANPMDGFRAPFPVVVALRKVTG